MVMFDDGFDPQEDQSAATVASAEKQSLTNATKATMGFSKTASIGRKLTGSRSIS